MDPNHNNGPGHPNGAGQQNARPHHDDYEEEPGVTELSRSEYDALQFQQSQRHQRNLLYEHQQQQQQQAQAQTQARAQPPSEHYDADSYYYDPPGVVSGTPELRQQHLAAPAAATSLRFPDAATYFDSHNPPQHQEDAESYLLHDMNPPAPSTNTNFATFLHMPPASSHRRPQFDDAETSYNPYTDTDQNAPRGNTNAQSSVAFDNGRIHNYYVGASLQNPAGEVPDTDDHDDQYNFMPFPVVASGDDYEVNTFMPGYNFDDDVETLLESSPQGPQAGGTVVTHMPEIPQFPHPEQQPYPEETSDEFQQPMLQQEPPQMFGPPVPEMMSTQQRLTPTPSQQQVPPPGPPSTHATPNVTIALFHGALVVDCPLSVHIRREFRKYLENAQKGGDDSRPKKLEEPREFQFMRYSAVTCEPETFFSKFSLRQQWYSRPRQTEIFICVTLYNETEDLLARTLQGIAKNIEFFSKKNSGPWGVESWLKIVVCIVADGRDNLNPRARMLMERLGVFQADVSQNMVGDTPVTAHLYEYSTILGIKDIKDTVTFKSLKFPMQYMFCVKEHNKGKINSHRWFFQAFSKILRPKICMLIDAGTVPSDNSIYQIWNSFERDPDVGGACGEIRASLGKGWRKLYNPLIAAQNFEYKMSNILDKPMESVMGFITVLPGAFSAYRYQALVNRKGLEEMDMGLIDQISGGALQKTLSNNPIQEASDEAGVNAVRAYDPIGTDPLLRDSPLGQYFKGETEKLRGKSAGIFTANMYLAEDRILCFELITKKNERWLLRYVKSAHATTDVPEHLSELVLQRRRWLNGSFFAAIYSISHFYQLSRANHNILRKIILLLEFFYQTVSILFSWFSIGNFFLVFHILTKSLGSSSLGFSPGAALGQIFLWIYCACIIAVFVLSFGNRPKGTQWFYIIVVCFFAILMAYLLFASIYISVKSIIYTLCINGGKLSVSFVFRNPLFRDLVVSLMSTYALYIVSSLLFLEPWHLITSTFQYLLIAPSFINVLNVYAFCNIHDISWGTKGEDKVKKDLGVAKIKDNAVVELNVPKHMNIIESSYLIALQSLSSPAPKVKAVVPEQIRTTDWYALFRSTVVLAWIFTNLGLVVIVLNVARWDAFQNSSSDTTTRLLDRMLTKRDLVPSMRAAADTVADYISAVALAARQTADADATAASCGAIGDAGTVRTEIYLTVILWSVAALAAFRFVGAVTYVILRLLGLH